MPARRLHRWVDRERLTHMGYLRGATPQGGYVLLVEAELAAAVETGAGRDPSVGPRQ